MLFAQNQAGYQQLCLLITKLNSNKKQVIIDDELEQYLSDVIVILKPQNNKGFTIEQQLLIVKKLAVKTQIYIGINEQNCLDIEF